MSSIQESKLNINQFVKILPIDMKCREMQYKVGENIDSNKFNPNGSCQKGGLYFTTLQYMPLYIEYGTLIADVSIDDQENNPIYYEPFKAKAHKITLSNIRELKDHPCWKDKNFCHIALKVNYQIMPYVKYEGWNPTSIEIKFFNISKLLHELVIQAKIYNIHKKIADSNITIESKEAQEYLKEIIMFDADKMKYFF